MLHVNFGYSIWFYYKILNPNKMVKKMTFFIMYTLYLWFNPCPSLSKSAKAFWLGKRFFLLFRRNTCTVVRNTFFWSCLIFHSLKKEIFLRTLTIICRDSYLFLEGIILVIYNKYDYIINVRLLTSVYLFKLNVVNFLWILSASTWRDTCWVAGRRVGGPPHGAW